MKSPFLNVSDEVHGGALRLSGHLAKQGYTLDAIHQYTTAQGAPTWWALRWKNYTTGEKRPLPMRRTETGFELKRPEFGPMGAPLYRLHVLANYPGEVVRLVEGEPCADLLEGLGYVATTWPNGAQNVGRSDLSPLAGGRVIAQPDNDEPGFEAMRQAKPILHGLGARVLTVDTAALGLPPKGDIVDWMRLFVARHGARHLHEIPNGVEKARAEIDAFPMMEWKKVAA